MTPEGYAIGMMSVLSLYENQYILAAYGGEIQWSVV